MKIYPKMFRLNDIFYLSKASMKMKIDPSTSPYVDNVLFVCVKCSNALRAYVPLYVYKYHSQFTLQSVPCCVSIIPFFYWYTTSFSGMESNLNFYIKKIQLEVDTCWLSFANV